MNTIHLDNAQKTQMDIVLLFFSQKNDRTVSNKLKLLKNLGKMIPQLKWSKKMQEMASFLP